MSWNRVFLAAGAAAALSVSAPSEAVSFPIFLEGVGRDTTGICEGIRLQLNADGTAPLSTTISGTPLLLPAVYTYSQVSGVLRLVDAVTGTAARARLERHGSCFEGRASYSGLPVRVDLCMPTAPIP